MPEKKLNYMKLREHASTEKEGRVYFNAYDAKENKAPKSKREPLKDVFRIYDKKHLGLDPDLAEVERAAIITANSTLSISSNSTRWQMIALGGTIGTGFVHWFRQSCGQRWSRQHPYSLHFDRYYHFHYCARFG